jgi:hypothetical protein
MEDVFGIFAVAVATLMIVGHYWKKDAQQRAAQLEAEAHEAAEQSALMWFRGQTWHIVIASICPDDDGEMCRAAECREWLKRSQNPTGVQVFVCHFREIDHHAETWAAYWIRLAEFRQKVRDDRAAEIKKADATTEGYSYYVEHVLRKRLPVAASFMPVLLVSNGGLLGISIIAFCVFGGYYMDSLTRPKTAKKQKKSKAPNNDHIENANKHLENIGVKVVANGNNLSLQAKEARKT